MERERNTKMNYEEEKTDFFSKVYGRMQAKVRKVHIISSYLATSVLARAKCKNTEQKSIRYDHTLKATNDS